MTSAGFINQVCVPGDILVILFRKIVVSTVLNKATTMLIGIGLYGLLYIKHKLHYARHYI